MPVMKKRMLLLMCFCFGASFAYASTSPVKTIIAKKKSITHSLFYSGRIEPLGTQAVTSSEDGTIESLNFQYGQPVKKNQLLFEVKSKKFQTTLVTTIKTYLTAKQALHQSQSKLAEQNDLWKYGLISRDAYTSAKTAYYNNEIALLQAQEQLVSMLKVHKSIKLNFEKLNLSDVTALKKILDVRFQSDIKVYAPVSGVALVPDKDVNQGLENASGGSHSGPVVKGSAVQQNQAVLSIGDLKGATVNIAINEVYVNKIKPGMKAVITSVAFPGAQLVGKVVRVGSQASSGGGDIPTFPVVIKVPTLTKAQRDVIRIGMSAKVDLEIKEKPMIMVPIKAVFQKASASFVKVKTAAGIKSVRVITGSTNLMSVDIQSGLKEGDKVVIPN